MFLEPLKAAKVVTEEQIKAIFSDITIIRSVNVSLLCTLQSRIENWSKQQKLGDIFLRMVSFIYFLFLICQRATIYVYIQAICVSIFQIYIPRICKKLSKCLGNCKRI